MKSYRIISALLFALLMANGVTAQINKSKTKLKTNTVQKKSESGSVVVNEKNNVAQTDSLAKRDTTKKNSGGGGTRMAITNKGIPSKGTHNAANKSSSNTDGKKENK